MMTNVRRQEHSADDGGSHEFPARIRTSCGGYIFDSKFDSGNLARVQYVNDREFNVWTTPDCAGTCHETGNRTWFYFAIRGVPQGQEIKFNVMNLNKQGKLYSQGMTPVVKIVPVGMDEFRCRWHRLCGRISYEAFDTGCSMSFTYTFDYSETKNNEAANNRQVVHLMDEHPSVLFAFCFPFSYTELQRKLSCIDDYFLSFNKQYKNYVKEGVQGKQSFKFENADASSIYYNRELLVRSIDGRRIDLLTISSRRGLSNDREPVYATEYNLFPDGTGTRPQRFPFSSCGKRVFFLSARVHPGETPSSHVLNGFLDFILDPNDPRAATARDLYVFKIVPMLNPDGVARGHYRSDQRGTNLNRWYLDPSSKNHPSIFAVKQVVLSHNSDNALEFYLDLHAHAAKRGVFIYGNALDTERQIENVLYPRLIALNTPHFDFSGCNFSEKNMSSKDKRDGLSKEGSGRVGIFKATGITHSYTLECNYNSGIVVNAIPAAQGDNGRSTPPPTVRVGPSPKYTPAIFEHVGRACVISLLDLRSSNPWSRLPRSEFSTITGARNWARQYVVNTLGYRLSRRPYRSKLGSSSSIVSDEVAAISLGSGSRRKPRNNTNVSSVLERNCNGSSLTSTSSHQESRAKIIPASNATVTKQVSLPLTQSDISVTMFGRQVQSLIHEMSDFEIGVNPIISSLETQTEADLPKAVRIGQPITSPSKIPMRRFSSRFSYDSKTKDTVNSKIPVRIPQHTVSFGFRGSYHVSTSSMVPWSPQKRSMREAPLDSSGKSLLANETIHGNGVQLTDRS